jgi:hypothetical protein
LDWAEYAARAFEPRPYETDPAAWVRDRLGEHPWSRQVEILESVRDHPFTAVKSCHGVGKSFIASRAASWWLDSHPPGSARVVTTAPTGDQVKAILWSEINGAAVKAEQRGNPFPGRVNQTEWMIGNQLVGLGRKPSDYNQHAFQGIHARYVLVVIDEACGVLQHFWTAALSIATGEHCRVLAIGNPDDPASHFAQVCASPLWHLIKISAFDSPNFSGEAVPQALAEVLVSRSYEQTMAAEYGTGSPIYISKVLAEFPDDAEDGVVRLSKLRACCLPRDTAYTDEQLLPVELGVDVGAGGDEAVIRERRGIVVGREWRTRTRDSEELVDLIVDAINETGATRVKVDSIGVGWGIVGSLRRRRAKKQHDAVIVGVNVGEAAIAPAKYLRLRSQIWWEVGRGLSESLAWDLSQLDEDDRDRLITQLTAPKYTHDAAGRIVVEKKEDTKARIGRSPDNADALLLAFYGGSGQGSAFAAAMKKRAQADGIDVPEVARTWRDLSRERGRRRGERDDQPPAQGQCGQIPAADRGQPRRDAPGRSRAPRPPPG